jgi:hypothetical protein
MSTNKMSIVVAGRSRLSVGGKVERGGPAQTTLVNIQAAGRGRMKIGGRGGLSSLEHS